MASKAHGSQPCMAEMSAYTCNILHSYSRGARPPSVNIGGATGPSTPPLSYSTGFGIIKFDLKIPKDSKYDSKIRNKIPEIRIRLCDHNAMFYRVLLGIRIIILLEISCDSRDSRQDSKIRIVPTRTV